MKYFLILIISFAFIFNAKSQSQLPPDIEWKEINSEHAQIIFPEELADKANEVANLIDYIYNLETKTMNSKPKKIPLIIYNKSTISNAYVGLRPWRSGWYITPSQYATDLNTDDWFYTLASHEYRHAVQDTHANTYFTKFMSIFFGETGILMGEYSYPFWFFEGDAVCMETGLSKGGRGRVPQFEMGIRTILLNDKKISYNKAKLYTYKDFYPGHYNLGWLMASYARKEYGADIWDRVIKRSSKYSYWPYAFSVALKKETKGVNEKKLFNNTMLYLDSVWTKDIENVDFTDINIKNQVKKKTWTKYTEPFYLPDGKMICKKASLDGDITAFYIISNEGKEEKIKNTDAGMYSVSGNKLCFSRVIPDARWGYRNYSDIIVFDIEKKKEKRITKKQKFFAPSFSPDGSKIAVVEYNDKMQTALVVLDSKTGKTIKRFKSENNDFIRTPSWSEDGKMIVYTNTGKTGTALSFINEETGIIEIVMPYGTENIGRPVFYKDYIIYNSPYSGIGNIYAIDTNTKQKYRIVSRKYGSYNPNVSKNKLLFIDYGIDGYDIAEIELKPENWGKIENIKPYVFERAENLVKQEQGKNVLSPELIPDKKFEVKKYSKIKHSLNFHSWGIDSDLDSKIGVNLYTANILNTVFGIAGGYYDINERRFSANATARFSKYYPVIDVIGGYAQRNVYYSTFDTYDEWTEMNGKMNFTLPINFSRGIYYRGANLSTGYTYTQKLGKEIRYISESGEGNFSSFSYSATIYNFRQQAMRDIDPKFGQFAYISYKNTPFSQTNMGEQFALLGSFYFPGILKHHSLGIKLGYEKQRTYNINPQNYYWFSSPLAFPRGFDYYAFDKMKTFSVNYKFPVFYPEFGLGQFLYFTRIRAGFFYDYADVNVLGGSGFNNFQSTGIEAFLQFYVLRLEMPFEIGGRFSYLVNQINKYNYEFITFRIPF